MVPRVRDAGGVALAQEIEPNDTPVRAQELALDGVPSLAGVNGTLDASDAGKRGDVDVFRLVVPGSRPSLDALADDPRNAGKRLAVDLTPDFGLALAVELVDEGLRTMASASADAGEALGLPNLSVLPGAVYFVRVKAAPAARTARRGDAGAAGTGYRLAVGLGEFEASEEREPNDRAERAQDVPWYNRSADVVGLAGWRRDEDWYRLTTAAVEPGWVVDLDLEAAEGVALSLTVYDEGRQKLVGVRGRRAERLTLKNVALPVAAGDAGAGGSAWYVVIRADAGQNRSRRYVLHVQAQPPGLPGSGQRRAMESEPNDAPAHASPLAEGATSGYLPLGDVDFYRLVLAQPRALTVEVTPPARVGVRIEIIRERDGEVLATAGPGKQRQTVSTGKLVCPAGEALLVRLWQGKRDGNASEPYLLTVVTAPPREPGDAQAP